MQIDKGFFARFGFFHFWWSSLDLVILWSCVLSYSIPGICVLMENFTRFTMQHFFGNFFNNNVTFYIKLLAWKLFYDRKIRLSKGKVIWTLIILNDIYYIMVRFYSTGNTNQCSPAQAWTFYEYEYP